MIRSMEELEEWEESKKHLSIAKNIPKGRNTAEVWRRQMKTWSTSADGWEGFRKKEKCLIPLESNISGAGMQRILTPSTHHLRQWVWVGSGATSPGESPGHQPASQRSLFVTGAVHTIQTLHLFSSIFPHCSSNQTKSPDSSKKCYQWKGSIARDREPL